MRLPRPFRRLERKLLDRIVGRLREIETEQQLARIAGIMKSMKSCGEGSAFWGTARVSGAENMALGRNVHIGDNAFIRAEGGLTIGDNTHISRNLVLYTVNHRIDGTRIPYDEELVKKPVRIGRNVWIGMNVCITPGTVIGDGAIIGMGTTVSGEVEPLSIIGSQKWRVIGQRDPDHYRRLDEEKAFGGPNGRAFLE